MPKLGGTKSNRRAGQVLAENWSEECNQSFEALKTELINATVLAYAYFSLPFILKVDASQGGLGAVLSQEQEGKVRPIAYASRGLSPTEWAMTEKFREYLLGHKCVVFTDNNPLSRLTSAKLGATEQRWAAQLAFFDFEIKYRSGRSNRNADALSHQYPPGAPDMVAMVPGTSLPEPLQQALRVGRAEATQTSVAALPHHTPSDICTLQQADPVIQELLVFWRWNQRTNHKEQKQVSLSGLTMIRQWDQLVARDGVLYRQVFRSDGGEPILQLLLPAVLKTDVLTQVHQEVERTLELLRQRCYWPGMSAEVAQWCQACERCQVA